jgi:hypothetical protein
MYTTDWVMRTDRMLCRPFNSEAIRRYPSGRTTRRPLLDPPPAPPELPQTIGIRVQESWPPTNHLHDARSHMDSA